MDITPGFSFNYKGRPFDLSGVKVENTGYGRRFALEDGLTLELHIDEYEKYNAIGWTVWLENTSDTESGLISDILDCDVLWCFADKGPVKLYETTGNTSYESYLYEDMCQEEFSVHERTLHNGLTRSYHPQGGRSCSGQMPFFELCSKDRGLIAAIGWSGQWRASFTREDGDVIRIKTGLEYTSFKLRPKERIRTSSVLLLEFGSDRVSGCNAFRRLIKELSPYSPEELPFALEGMGMTTEKHLYHIDKFRKHGVKADYYWIDAGWYGKGGEPGASDWYKQVGNWQVRPDEHPDGLLDVVAAVEDSGMKMLLWFEPERAYPGTDIAVKHPEWLYPLDGFYLLLRLELDEVRDYLFDMICGFIDRLHIKCFRQDFNMEPLQSWRITDEPYRGGMNEIRYIMNLYKLWDDLRAKYPGLVIDNCASGGRRIDIETLKRTVPVWRTDAYCEPTRDPDVIQTQTFGFSRFVPYSGGVCKKPGDTYAARSAYAPAYVGSWWWTDRPEPSDVQFEWMAKMCEEYKALRPYFSCDFYPLENCGRTEDHGGWAAYRYDRPEQNDGIVAVFRRSGSNCVSSCYKLENLRPDRVYTVTDADTKEEKKYSGHDLINEGLTVTIDERYKSRILIYKAI
ncbi:MAG: alpha-galactosidase [Clostridia bacterium]|nr:alpha-galactosidase [Clostridia bacterium]